MTDKILDIAAAGIPRFHLFGEEETAADAEFIHVEDIRSRSSRYGWEITPHAHGGLFQVVVVTRGRVRARLDDQQHQADGPLAIVLPPAVVHAFAFQEGTDGHVLSVAETMLMGTDGNRHDPFIAELFLQPRMVALEPDQAGRVSGLIGQLAEELRWPLRGRALMFDWLMRAVQLLNFRQAEAGRSAGGKDRLRAQTFHRFRLLVESHFHQHWTVPRYAEALSTTESRLNRICKDLSGKTAFDIVCQRLILEAKRKLLYIAAPVTLLSYELGFQDPAYFCRFFKRHTGLSPARFRQRSAAADEEEN